MKTHVPAEPCGRFEFDIADLVDEQLPLDREAALRGHLGQCASCRGWLEEYASVDAVLASEHQPVHVSPDFETRLKARIVQAGPLASARPTLLRLDEEYRQLMTGLRLEVRRRVLSAVAVTLALGTGTWLLFTELAARGDALPATPLYGLVGTVFAFGALAWSAGRGLLPMTRR